MPTYGLIRFVPTMPSRLPRVRLLGRRRRRVLTTYTAQNLGAGKAKRVKKGALIGTGLSVIAVGIISIVLYFGSGLIGPLFIDQKDVPTLIPLVIRYMQMMAPFFVFYAVAEALSGACSGLGETLVSMVTTLLTICLFRVVCILVVLPSFKTMECIVWIYIGSWVVSRKSEKVSCFFAPKIKYGTLRHLLFSF